MEWKRSRLFDGAILIPNRDNIIVYFWLYYIIAKSRAYDVMLLSGFSHMTISRA